MAQAATAMLKHLAAPAVMEESQLDIALFAVSMDIQINWVSKSKREGKGNRKDVGLYFPHDVKDLGFRLNCM